MSEIAIRAFTSAGTRGLDVTAGRAGAVADTLGLGITLVRALTCAGTRGLGVTAGRAGAVAGTPGPDVTAVRAFTCAGTRGLGVTAGRAVLGAGAGAGAGAGEPGPAARDASDRDGDVAIQVALGNDSLRSAGPCVVFCSASETGGRPAGPLSKK